MNTYALAVVGLLVIALAVVAFAPRVWRAVKGYVFGNEKGNPRL